MVDYAIEIAKDMKIETLYAIMLPDNFRAINLMKKMGFTIIYSEDGQVKGTLDLKEEALTTQPIKSRASTEAQTQTQAAPIEERQAEALQS